MFGVGSHVRTVTVGDRVLYARDDQYEVEVQGTTFLVLREREVHSVATERTDHGTGLYLWTATQFATSRARGGPTRETLRGNGLHA